MEENKVVNAKIFIDLVCTCPHCKAFLDFFDYISNHLCLNVFDNVGQIFEVRCSECNENFDIEIEN